MEINNYDYIADLYDIYVPATFDIEFFLIETKKSNGEVLELMSGTGRVSIPLLEAGVKLTCLDISPGLNTILEEKLRTMGLEADVHQMDIRSFELQKQFNMVIIPFHSFAHLTALDDQKRALAQIHRHLSPGGTFICTLGNPKLRQRNVDGQLRLFRKYALENQGSLLLWIVEDNNSDDEKVVEAKQFYEEYDAKGVLISKRLLELHFRLSPKNEFEELAKTAGFKIKALYGDYEHSEFDAEDSPFMIWILEKVA